MNDPEKNAKLEQALRGMARDRIFVPPDRDEKVLAAIHEHFAGQQGEDVAARALEMASRAPRQLSARRVPRKALYRYRWMPLAASLAIAAIILFFPRPAQSDRADINRDGTVDIVDALLLAEAIRAGGGEDLNNDGAITEADAAEIAARAVSLERSGS